MVRAKFNCTGITPEGNVTLEPVVGGSPENDAFFEATPWGKVEIGTVNPNAIAQFEVGKSYYVDFTQAME